MNGEGGLGHTELALEPNVWLTGRDEPDAVAVPLPPNSLVRRANATP